VRVAAQAVNPDFAVIIENFPMDYMDATKAGLDATTVAPKNNLIHVWETDSVSNTQAMKWSSQQDFENKIAMLKWGKGIMRDEPSWSFSYGNEALDAGLSMSAVVATHNVPFEAKTPDMITSVGADFRANWFGYLRDHEQALLNTPRSSQVGVWYSARTRDYQDFPQGGEYPILRCFYCPVLVLFLTATRQASNNLSTQVACYLPPAVSLGQWMRLELCDQPAC